MLKSAVVPSRISGGGETGANPFPSKPTLMVSNFHGYGLQFSQLIDLSVLFKNELLHWLVQDAVYIQCFHILIPSYIIEV